jgi:hypothetical protein
MVKVVAPLSILAIALLSACSSPGPSSPASAGTQPAPIATQELPYRAGSGVVQSANPAPGMASAGASTSAKPAAPSASASAASPAAPPTSGLQRLGIKMDDGRMQYVDTSSRDFPVGTRVQLSESFEIKK